MELDLKSIFQRVSAGELGAQAALKLIQAGRSADGPQVTVELERTSENLLYYAPSWMEENLHPAGKPAPPGNLIVFGCDDLLYRALQIRESDAPHNRGCALVLPGQAFRATATGMFEARPGEISDIREVFARSRLDESRPVLVVHAWNVHEGGEASYLASSKGLELCRAGWKTGPATVFAIMKVLAELKVKTQAHLLFLHASEDSSALPHNEAVAGMLRTGQSENPRQRGKSICFSGPTSTAQMANACIEETVESSERKAVEIRIQGGRRTARRFVEWTPSHISDGGTIAALPKRKGVYLITGGFGGLGRLFARELVDRFQAGLILLGRSQPFGPQKKFMEDLGQTGARILHQQADVSDPIQVEDAIRRARRAFPAINGVIHCAGVIEDALVGKKTPESFSRVVSPKVAGTMSLDLALRDEPLDFFVLFSSLAAVAGNPGQCDYAAGNCFMDAFAESRERLRERGGCSGRTVAINWPLWEDGGMQIPEATRKFMLRALGVKPLGRRAGIRAFFTALKAGESQIGVLEGDVQKIRASEFLSKNNLPPAPLSRNAAKNGQGRCADAAATDVTNTLREIVSQVLKVKPDDLNLDTDLHDYGMESVLMMEVVQALESRFNIILDASTIISHTNIRAIGQHLESTFGPALLPKNANAQHDEPLIQPAENGAIHHVEEPRISPSVSIVATPTKAVARAGLAPFGEPIAVIGMACRLPGARTPDQFWRNLKEGKHSIREVPADRWDVSRYFSLDRSLPRKTYSKWGGFIDGVDLFDADFFGISQSDAPGIDPGHRLALEMVQELFDQSGFRREDYRKTRTGVFLGGGRSAYTGNVADRVADDLLPRLVINTIPNMMAGRVANFFDLRGPAEIMDTACSSSMVAIQKACRSISVGESDMAIAGGVSLCLDVYPFIGFCTAGALSPTPVPYIFTEQANGFVLGEGAGLVLLKPLSRAVADGDMIHGLVLGCASNNDGHTMGWTTPNVEAQRAVIEEAYGISGESPNHAGYFEAHGTGTLLGDPIEVRAATQVFSKHSNRKQFCALGSVKSNIGHTLHAAGVASVLKALLCLRNKEIPPALHSSKPHPRFKLHESPFFLPAALGPFPAFGLHRVASASSFGFGGTNCHIVLREWDALAEHCVARRKPLPATEFRRKRFWIEPLSPDQLQRVGEESWRNTNAAGSFEMPTATPVPAESAAPHPRSPALAQSAQLTAQELEELLTGEIAGLLKVPKSAIDVEANFDELGLDSTSMVEAAGKLESEFKLEVYPTLLFEYPNIRKLAGYFAENNSAPSAAPTESDAPPAPSLNGSSSNGHAQSNQAPGLDTIEQQVCPDASPIPPPQTAANLAERIEKYLTQRLGDALSIPADQIAPEASFMEMGADSVGLVDVARRFEEELGIELYPTLFFEYPNIRELAGYFATEHGAKFLEKFREETGIRARVMEPTPASVSTVEVASARNGPVSESRERGRKQVSERDIAIIGMAGRFAGSQNVAEFWRHLKDGTDLITEIPDDRWDNSALFDARLHTPDKMYCKWGSFVDGLDKFDASFFRVPEEEARLMDPQLRFFLEVIQAAADDAGYGERLKGTRTGVYVGNCYHDYSVEMRKRKDRVEPYEGTGNAPTMLANRPSYHWDLRGPSLALDTACSSSLVAIHLACRALREGECEMAVAGGVNLIISPLRYLYFCCLGALSPTGRCHSFDSRADGYVPAEAVACVLLKPLAAALRDGDPIHAVIKGSAVNHGGAAASVTAPNPTLQAQVLAAAWADAMIEPDTLSYFEAHGTGTKLGDPIEIQGIKLALKNFKKQPAFCAVGSAKAHIGHAEGAAGVAGVIKTVLSMKHGLIPAMPRFSELNPMIRLDNSPLRIAREAILWKSPDGQPLRAGVSSFGFGGTCAHLVIESFSQDSAPSRPADRPPTISRTFDRQSYWFEPRRVAAPPTPNSQANDANPTTTEIPAASAPNSLSNITDFLRETLGRIVGTNPGEIDPDAALADMGYDSVMGMHLIRAIQEHYDLPIYSAEILEQPTLSALATHLHRETSQPGKVGAVPPSSSVAPTAKLPSGTAGGERISTKTIVFILSAPRSGSTLLRVMLAGHSRLFCPPELHLLPFKDMGERARSLSGGMKFLNEGLIRAVMELRGVAAEGASDIVREMEDEAASTTEAFEALAEMAAGRLLVDKSPTYGESADALARSRKLFPNARYIFLTRHPCAAIESFARNRFDKMLGRAGEDPWTLGETTWARINQNIFGLKTEVPDSQWFDIQYEDLVAAPQKNAKAICNFLGVPFEAALIEPYNGKRMTDGIYDVSLSIGDPNFLKHERIETGLVDDWKTRWPDGLRLSANTVTVAGRLGYQIEESRATPQPLSPSQREFLAAHPGDRRWNITHRVRFQSPIPLDHGAMETAWKEIIQRHEQLRLFFKSGEAPGEVTRILTANRDDFRLEWRDASVRTNADLETEVKEAINRANDSIDWRVWPLMRTVVFALGDGKFELVWTHHHLVADGFSALLVLEELFNRLDSRRGHKVPLSSFADYCLEAATLEAAANFEAASALYTTQGNLPPFRLPSCQDAAVSLFSDEREIVELWRVAAEHWPAATFDLAATALYQALGEWTGHSAPIVSHRIHGRNLGTRSYHDAVGFFAHDVPLTLPLADGIDSDALVKNFGELLRRARQIPYPSLVLAGKAPTAQRLTPVRLNFQPAGLRPAGAIQILQQDRRVWQPPAETRPYPLDLIVRLGGQEMRVIARFSDSQIEERSVLRLLELWRGKFGETIRLR